MGAAYAEPEYTYRGFEALTEDWEHPDPELEKTADLAIDLVCQAQQAEAGCSSYC